MSGSSFKKLEPEEYLRQHYQQDLRPDGRKGLNILRPISISVGSISVADGSAVVKQGDTIVVKKNSFRPKLLKSKVINIFKVIKLC